MTQGSFERSWTTHYKDLRGIYAKRMQLHGNGMALMQPISGEDCQPVSVGYFDRNGDWNLIARLIVDGQPERDDFFEPLEYMPAAVTDISISWQPKTSLGVTALTVDASGETPDGVPGGVGVDAHIRYSSDSKFGAVLMTTTPVTLRAYNDEALFASWLSRNKTRLYRRYGPELKKYGLWIVTRTYTTRRASINAWMDKHKDSVVSLKAKAAMLGELGEELDWKDKALDKDWSHYEAKTKHGVVVFIDGIEVKPFDWWLEGVRSNLQTSNYDRGRRLSRYVPDPIHHQATVPIHQLPGKSAMKKRSPSQPRASISGSPQSEPARPRAVSQSISPDPFPRRPSEASARRPSEPSAMRHSGNSPRRQSESQDPVQASPLLSADHAIRRTRDQTGSLSLPPVRRRNFSVDDGRPETLVADDDFLLQDISGSLPEALPRNSYEQPTASPSLHVSKRDISRKGRRPYTLAEEDILQAAGMSSISRSQSLRKTSLAASVGTASTRSPSISHSLRREVRSVYEANETDTKLYEFFSRDTSGSHHTGLPPALQPPSE